jgi:mannitol PTS system EIICBA or EIICB component
VACAAASPGSIIAIMAVTPPGGHLSVLAGITTATVVSFVVASLLLGFGRSERKAAREEAEAAAKKNSESSEESVA